jgi:polysaccharide export outer membrane protein
MKSISSLILLTLLIIAASCTSQRDLAYLTNLPETGGEQFFPMDIPDYKIQHRDILYITIKAMTPDGSINDFLSSSRSGGSSSFSQGEAGQYLMGYDVNLEGEILVPILGTIKVGE